MSDEETKRKPGRPKKEAHSGNENHEREIGDASQDRIAKYSSEIIRVMTKDQSFSKHFADLSDVERLNLAKELAHELCYFPLLKTLPGKTEKQTTGPRPKVAESIFLTQVQEKLIAHGVVLPQWKNNRDQKDVLRTFCKRIASVTATKSLLVSLRSVANAPKVGFRAIE